MDIDRALGKIEADQGISLHFEIILGALVPVQKTAAATKHMKITLNYFTVKLC